MFSLKPRSRARSICGFPNCTPQLAAWSASPISLATWRRAFEGMQPRYRQTPPGFASGSMSVTCMPRSAARNAAAYPPGPAPMTARLILEFSGMLRRGALFADIHPQNQAFPYAVNVFDHAVHQGSARQVANYLVNCDYDA